MSQEEYRAKRDRILFLINKSQTGNNFALEQVSERIPMQAYAMIVREENYLTEIKLNGSDKVGTWKARGFILVHNGQMKLWFYKEYDNKDYAQQTDEWEDLIYESLHYDERGGMEGRWFYHGFELTNEYSGKWKLWEPVNDFGGNNPGYGGQYSPPPPYFN